MDDNRIAKFLSISNNKVTYRLKIAFAILFFIPFLGFLYLSLHYDFLYTNEGIFLFLATFIFSFLGYHIMHEIVDGLEKVAATVTGKVADRLGSVSVVGDELEKIATSFNALNQHIEQTAASLERRMLEIAALRDLGYLSLTNIDAQTLITRSLAQASEIAECRGAAFFALVNRGGVPYLICHSIIGHDFLSVSGKSIPLSQHPARQALETTRAMLLAHESGPDWKNAFSDDAGCIAALPIVKTDGLLGVALLARKLENPWPEDILTFLSSFFITVSAALNKKGLELMERERSNDLKTVLYIIETINSGLTENEMLLAIADKLDEVIPYHSIELALMDLAGGQLKLAHTFRQTSTRAPLGLVFPEEKSIVQMAMRSKGIIRLNNLEDGFDYFEKEIRAELGQNSCLLAGLNFKGQPLGAICLSHNEKDTFKKKHEHLLSMIAEGMSLAIGQARLLDQAKTKTAELEAINQIGRALTSSTFNMERVLQYTIAMISRLIKAEGGSLLLLEGEELVFKVALGATGDILRGLRIKSGQGVVGWVAASGEPLMVRDVKDNPHFFSEVDTETGFSTRNLICVPMIVGGHTIGVIELVNKIEGTFNDGDLNVLKSVASSAAIALENSRLYAESIQKAEKEKLIRNIFQKYVPEEIANEILDLGERDLISLGNRRQVTLLNVDIRGYSRMFKESGAEDVVEVLNFFFMVMGSIVFKRKGVVDKYLGDGLLAFFGAPVASRNPALDATLAAMEMVESIETVAEFARSRYGISIKIGISLNTGEAIVGNIGFEKKMDYTAIGDVVNDTFRLQELTKEKPNSILLSAATREKIAGYIETSSRGFKNLGREDAEMEIFEVTETRKASDLEYIIKQAGLRKIT